MARSSRKVTDSKAHCEKGLSALQPVGKSHVKTFYFTRNKTGTFIFYYLPMEKILLPDHIVLWLREKLNETESVIKESKLSHNYGKATQYEGKREAYMECLRKLNTNVL